MTNSPEWDDLRAVACESIETGAVISFSGDTLVVGAADIVDAVESRLIPPTSAVGSGDRWLTESVPVLSRGEAWIVPLAWVPFSSGSDAVERRTLSARVVELSTAIRSACWYRFGDGLALDLAIAPADRRPYASELVRMGARRAEWWAIGEKALVLVIHGDPVPAPVSLTAIHVVPLGWVSQRTPPPAKRSAISSLEWTWTEVVTCAGSAAPLNDEGPANDFE